jgi:Protein of unknown function (DUF1236)
MKAKYLAHLALAGVLVFGTGATGAEKQNQKGNPGQARSGGSPHPHVNAGGGAKFHAQPGAGVSRGNIVRVQNQNRITVREQNFNRNVTINRNVTRNRAVINQQNFKKRSVERIERNKIRTGDKKLAGKGIVVQLSQIRRTHIREAFRHHRDHFHRVARVGFPIFVGAYVPSDYTFYDVPSDFVEYAPEYDGYKYIVVGDEILIIDPQTWEIVAIIPV